MTYAQTLTARVLDKWHQNVRENGREFLVLYIPSRREILKPAAQQDTWIPWLQEYCEQNEIVFVDPAERFAREVSDGREMYYDHFTAAGHGVFSEVFLDKFTGTYANRRSSE